MEKWNKTIIVWPMWDYHISGYELPKDGKPTIIYDYDGVPVNCTTIRAESQQTREIKLTVVLFAINKKTKHSPSTTGTEAASDRLYRGVLARAGNAGMIESSPRGECVLRVPLRQGEKFCERAVELVGQILEALGVDDSKKRLCGNFEISQTTFVKSDGEWQSYEDWLRHQFGLEAPYIYCWTN